MFLFVLLSFGVFSQVFFCSPFDRFKFKLINSIEIKPFCSKAKCLLTRGLCLPWLYAYVYSSSSSSFLSCRLVFGFVVVVSAEKWIKQVVVFVWPSIVFVFLCVFVYFVFLFVFYPVALYLLSQQQQQQLTTFKQSCNLLTHTVLHMHTHKCGAGV